MYWNSNPRPVDFDSHPSTTSPGMPHNLFIFGPKTFSLAGNKPRVAALMKVDLWIFALNNSATLIF